MVGSGAAVALLQSEIHGILAALRLASNSGTVATKSSRQQQQLSQSLREFLGSSHASSKERLRPFLDVIQDSKVTGAITGVALGVIEKFVSYDYLEQNEFNRIAEALTGCRFVATSGFGDEVVMNKLMAVMTLLIAKAKGQSLISDTNIWNMIKKCFQISRQYKASYLLRSSSENCIQQIILNVLLAPSSPSSTIITNILKFVTYLSCYGAALPESQADGVSRLQLRNRCAENAPTVVQSPSNNFVEREIEAICNSSGTVLNENVKNELRSFGLSLLSLVLEVGHPLISNSADLVEIVQCLTCKALLLHSIANSGSYPFVQSMTMRLVVALYRYLRAFLKPQLELLLVNLHFRMMVENSKLNNVNIFALDSLFEFFKEPGLSIELFQNYDCDIRCTNLFQILAKQICIAAQPSLAKSVLKKLRAMKTSTGSVVGGGGDHTKSENLSPRLLKASSIEPYRVSCFASVLLIFDSPVTAGGTSNYPVKLSLGRIKDSHQLGLVILVEMLKGLLAAGDVTSSDHQIAILEEQKEIKTRLAKGAQVFNNGFKKCLPELQALGLLPTPLTVQSMAEFLRGTPGLDLAAVGEFLASPGEWFEEVREAFMQTLDFKSVSVVEALRLLLSSFRLPGEAQQIDRLMEAFAREFFSQQVTVTDAELTPVDTQSSSPPLPEFARMPRWVAKERYRLLEDGTVEEVEQITVTSELSQSERSEEEIVVEPITDVSGIERRGGWGFLGGRQSGTAAPGIRDVRGKKILKPANEEASIETTHTRFPTSDSVFVLSFSIIMLNTDMHNPMIKKKMTVEAFTKNSKGILDSDEQYLYSVYAAIKARALAMVPPTNSMVHLLSRQESWDYLLKRPSHLGKTAINCSPFPQLQLRIWDTILWKDCRVLSCILRIFTLSRRPQQLLLCVDAFAQLIEAGSRFHLHDLLFELAASLLQFCQLTFSFRTQLVVPLMVRLLNVAAVEFDVRGWLVILEFLSRLSLLGMAPKDLANFDAFPVTPQDSEVYERCWGTDASGTDGSIAKLLSNEMYGAQFSIVAPTSWLSELTALFLPSATNDSIIAKDDEIDEERTAAEIGDFSGTDAEDIKPSRDVSLENSNQRPTAATDEDESVRGGRDSDLEEEPDDTDSQIGGDHQSGRDLLVQITALNCSFRFWKTTNLFAHPLSKATVSSVEILQAEAVATSFDRNGPSAVVINGAKSMELFRLILAERMDTRAVFASCHLEEKIRASVEESLLAALILRAVPPSVTTSAVAVEELLEVARRLTREVWLNSDTETAIRHAMRLDPVPLCRLSRSEVLSLKPQLDSAAALELLSQFLVENENSANPNITAWSVVTEHFHQLLVLCADLPNLPLLTKLMKLKKSDVVVSASQGDKILSLEEAIKITQQLLVTSTSTEVTSRIFVERLVLCVLKLSTALGHRPEKRISIALVRLLHDVSCLRRFFFSLSFFQICGALQLLLDNEVFGQGMQAVVATDLWEIDESLSEVKAMPLILAQFIFCSSPAVSTLAMRSLPLHVQQNFPLQAVYRNAADLLGTITNTTWIHKDLQLALTKKDPQQIVRKVCRYWVQCFLCFALPSAPSIPGAGNAHETLDPMLYDLEVENEESDNAIACRCSALLVMFYSHVAEGGPTDIWEFWAPVAQAFTIIGCCGTKRQRRDALMALQHQLTLIPKSTVETWVEVVELILFPLLSQTFTYPYPHIITSQESFTNHNDTNLGTTLLALYPNRTMETCKVPGATVVEMLTSFSGETSPYARLPRTILIQRKSQAVGFLCRILLGKIDHLFYDLDLFPVFIRVIRIFLYELLMIDVKAHQPSHEAFVEAIKNFLLVLATSPQLSLIKEEDALKTIHILNQQDPRTLVVRPHPNVKAPENLEEGIERCLQYGMSRDQKKENQLLFAVVVYIFELANLVHILKSIFDILAPLEEESQMQGAA